MLNRWLAVRGCPQYAGLYQVAGQSYGVRWDVAVFQSIKETGWFKFGGDVSPAQNNFAGIGASGGGVPGDSFPSPMAGITAQIQNLALRAGRPVAEREILSPYVKKNYSYIKNRNTPFWEQLAGTWATDPLYWKGIAAIAEEFDAWMLTQDLEASVTWFELNRTPEGLPVAVAMAGDTAKTILVSADKSVLIDFLLRHPNARTFAVAPAGKSVPGVPEYNRGDTPDAPPPEPTRPLVGVTIGLDPGHSRSSAGASGTGSNPPSEYLLNLLASNTRRPLLEAAGADVEIFDPNPDNLSRVGDWGAS